MLEPPQEVVETAKKVVKVYISPQQKRILQRMCLSLGLAESEALRTAFLDYAKSIGIVTEKILSIVPAEKL
jgi:hypothetical protein